MNFDNNYMIEALKIAKKALASDEVPVGAVIVHNQKIISRAHNLTETKTNPTFHAEILAISKASKKLGTNKLTECDMYVTLEPCPMCAQAISFARIRRLYFGALDRKGGGVENGPRIYNSSSCHHRPEIYSGILESDCSILLRDFFKTKRIFP